MARLAACDKRQLRHPQGSCDKTKVSIGAGEHFLQRSMWTLHVEAAVQGKFPGIFRVRTSTTPAIHLLLQQGHGITQVPLGLLGREQSVETPEQNPSVRETLLSSRQLTDMPADLGRSTSIVGGDSTCWFCPGAPNISSILLFPAAQWKEPRNPRTLGTAGQPPSPGPRTPGKQHPLYFCLA